MPAPAHSSSVRFLLGGLCALGLGACAGAPGADPGAPAPATEAEWRALRAPRPEPLSGAAAVSLTGIQFAGPYDWPYDGSVGPELGTAELAVAGLLGRRDVTFVERRRFGTAAAMERSGQPAPAGRPPVGVSRGIDFTATAIFGPLPAGGASLEVRLTEASSGEVAGATRIMLSAADPPLVVARAVVEGILTVLDDLGRRPAWSAPEARVDRAAGAAVPDEAVRNFLRGLAYEEAWRWEGARVGYEAAATIDGFPEARAALARAARLRLGGTLAES